VKVEQGAPAAAMAAADGDEHDNDSGSDDDETYGNRVKLKSRQPPRGGAKVRLPKTLCSVPTHRCMMYDRYRYLLQLKRPVL
jgi:hypothetical protein